MCIRDSDNTGFAETVEVSYDPRQADLKLLIELFFKTIDPTSINRQGNDIGSQYRTGIYYTNTDDLPIIKETVEALAKNYSKPIVVEIQDVYKRQDIAITKRFILPIPFIC